MNMKAKCALLSALCPGVDIQCCSDPRDSPRAGRAESRNFSQDEDEPEPPRDIRDFYVQLGRKWVQQEAMDKLNFCMDRPLRFVGSAMEEDQKCRISSTSKRKRRSSNDSSPRAAAATTATAAAATTTTSSHCQCHH